MTPRRREYGSGSVYRRADGKWVGTMEAGWTASGARRRTSVTGRTEAEVKRKLRDKAVERRAGQAVASSRLTVKAWSEQWLAMRQHKARPKTYGTERGALRKYVVPTIGHVRLDALTPAHVRAVRDAVTADHSTTTALRYHRMLVKMLRDAIRDGHRVPSRVLITESPSLAPVDRRAMTAHQAGLILDAAATRGTEARWAAALVQGMRQGECLGLTWDQVARDRVTVSWQLQALPYLDKHDRARGFRIPDGYEARQLGRSWHLVRPKSRAGWRVLPLVPYVRDLLDDLWQTGADSPHGLVWPADGGLRRPADDRDEWRALQREAGVAHPSGRPYVTHEARHTTSTVLLALGVEESVRIAILGHSCIAVTRGYEHVGLGERARALEGVARALGRG
jgi:integrase